MTTPPLFNHQPPRRRSWRISEIISWLVVVAVVLTIAIRVILQQKTTLPGSPTQDLQLKITAQYAVGVKALLPQQDDATIKSLINQFDEAAHSPREKLAAA